MIILLGITFLVFFIISAAFCWDDDILVFFAFGFLVCLVVAAICGGVIVHGRTLQSKIDMYTEQNQSIEEDLNTLVENYMKYESGTYGTLKGESSVTLVSMYPELKSDKLVEKQLSIYVDNNDHITELRESLINRSSWKWWLYFGK